MIKMWYSIIKPSILCPSKDESLDSSETVGACQTSFVLHCVRKTRTMKALTVLRGLKCK